MFYILSQKQEVSIKEISDELYVSHSAISQLISSLQQKGLIKSVVSKKDARHKAITFTAKGTRLLQTNFYCKRHQVVTNNKTCLGWAATSYGGISK